MTEILDRWADDEVTFRIEVDVDGETVLMTMPEYLRFKSGQVDTSD